MSREVLENRLSRAVTHSGLTYDFFCAEPHRGRRPPDGS